MAKSYFSHRTNKNLLRSLAYFHPATELVEVRHPLCSAQKNAIPHHFGLRFFCFYKGRSRFSLRFATIKTLHFLPSSTRSRLASFHFNELEIFVRRSCKRIDPDRNVMEFRDTSSSSFHFTCPTLKGKFR